MSFLSALLIALSFVANSATAAERVWVPGWRETAPLTTPRAGAAVIETNGYVYALGGVDGRHFLRTVEYATIRADGTLGPWNLAAPLTEERGFFDAVAHAGFLYAAGGGNGANGEHLLASVERAPLRADGRLGPWERLPVSMRLPRRCVKLAIASDALYALGGFGGTLLDSVERASFTPAGLGPFELEPQRLTMPRYVNAAKASDGALYVLGGHDQDEGSGLTAVEYAAIPAAGAALMWTVATPLAAGRYGLAALAHGGYLYALGGLDGARYSASIERSRIGSDHAPGPWRGTTPLSSPRANFGTFDYGGRLYVVGGTNRDGYYRTVEYAQVDAAGDIGYWATPAEAAAAAQRAAAQHAQAQASALPNAGTVREILHTGVYSYIRVAGENGERWIAGPRVDYAVGDRIGYSRGTEMSGFRSRALDRTFESILFVESTARE